MFSLACCWYVFKKSALTWKQGLLFHKVTSWTMIVNARSIPLTQGSLAEIFVSKRVWSEPGVVRFKLVWYWNTHTHICWLLTQLWHWVTRDFANAKMWAGFVLNCSGTSKILGTMLVPCTMCLFQHVFHFAFFPFLFLSFFLLFFRSMHLSPGQMGGLHFQQAHNSGATWQVDALLDCIAHLAADPEDWFCCELKTPSWPWKVLSIDCGYFFYMLNLAHSQAAK